VPVIDPVPLPVPDPVAAAAGLLLLLPPLLPQPSVITATMNMSENTRSPRITVQFTFLIVSPDNEAFSAAIMLV
jgi:hypothetical protein